MERLLQQQNRLLETQDRNLDKASRDGDRLVEKVQELTDVTQSGLLDNNKGLNSNVIKLTQALRESLLARRNNTAAQDNPNDNTSQRAVQSSIIPVESRSQENEQLRERSVASAEKADETPRTLTDGIKNAVENFKKSFTLEGMFDITGDGKGIIGSLVSGAKTRRENEERRDEYVSDQMTVNPQMSNLSQYKREDGTADVEKIKAFYANRYDEIQNVKSQQQSNENTITGLQERGATDKQLSRAGLIKTRGKLDDGLATVDPTGYGREREEQRVSAKGDNAITSNVIPFPQKDSGAPLSSSAEETQSENLRMMEDQNQTLKQIEENTRPLADLGSQLEKLGAGLAAGLAAGQSEGGGSLLGPIPTGGSNKTPKGSPKPKGTFRNAISRLGSPAAKLGGAALAVGMGAYQAYSGFSSASEEEQQQLASIEEQQQSGQLTKEQADVQRREIVDTTDVVQSESVGGGLGTAAGALAGAKAGAMVGTFAGPVGTVVGGLAGGAIGAIAGSGVGKDIGRGVAKGWQAVRGFFGGEADIPESKNEAQLVEAEKTSITFSERDFSQKDPESYKKFKEYRRERAQFHVNERKAKRGGKVTRQSIRMDQSFAEENSKTDAIIKFKKEIEAAGAGTVKTTRTVPEGTVSGNPEEQPVRSSQGIIKSYQAVGQEKKMADQAVKDFETNNPLEKTEERDYFGDRMMGYNDPEKAAEYKKLTDTQRQKTKEQKKIGAEYAAKDGVTNTHAFKNGYAGKRDAFSENDSDANKILALKDRGYTDKDLGENKNLESNYIRLDNKKYPSSALGLYEDVIKQELETTKVSTVSPTQPGAQRTGNIKIGGDISSPTAVQPREPQSGDTIYQQSGENAAQVNQPPAPVQPSIVNAPTSNVINNSNYAAPKIARSPESSYSNYSKRRFNY